jgi:uncharacterized protein (DUF4415 family)
MKGKRTGNTSTRATTDWKRLSSLSDRAILKALESDPEVRPTDVGFWERAKVVKPRSKQIVTIRLDADLLEWLREEKGYQTRINAVLRTYMDAKRKPAKRTTA